MQLAEKIVELTGAKYTIIHKPLPNDDPKQRKPDISLAKAELKWMPKIALEEGLKMTIGYFQQLIEKIEARRRTKNILFMMAWFNNLHINI